MAKKNFYVVKRGRRCGIFSNWEECKSQVDKFPNAAYKGYVTYEEAVVDWEKHTIQRDSASGSRLVQTVQEQTFSEGHSQAENKDKIGKTPISSIYAFVLGSVFTLLVFLVCIVAIFVSFSIVKSM